VKDVLPDAHDEEFARNDERRLCAHPPVDFQKQSNIVVKRSARKSTPRRPPYRKLHLARGNRRDRGNSWEEARRRPLSLGITDEIRVPRPRSIRQRSQREGTRPRPVSTLFFVDTLPPLYPRHPGFREDLHELLEMCASFDRRKSVAGTFRRVPYLSVAPTSPHSLQHHRNGTGPTSSR